MNPFRISGGSVSVFSIGLKRPFITALGRKDRTTNAAVRLRLQGGAEGRGEASGSVVLARQKPERLAGALESMLKRLRGRDARRLGPLAFEIWRDFGAIPAAAAAFECALTEAMLAELGVPMAAWFGGAQKSVETDLTLSAASASETAAAAKAAARSGFKRLKVKVGSGLREDLTRVLAADAAGRIGRKRPEIILDGNQKLGVAGAQRLTELCLKAGLKIILLEQPVGRERLKDMARLCRALPIPIAADESIRSPQDALRVLDMNAANVINIKVAKSGLRRARDIIALARAAGVRLMIGCMQETARGLTPSVHLACGTGAFEFVDLDSDVLLADAQPRGGFRRSGAVLRI